MKGNLPVKRTRIRELVERHYSGERVFVAFSCGYDDLDDHLLGLIPAEEIFPKNTDIALLPISTVTNIRSPLFIALTYNWLKTQTAPDIGLTEDVYDMITGKMVKGSEIKKYLETLEAICGFVPMQMYLLYARNRRSQERLGNMIGRIQNRLGTHGVYTALFSEQDGGYLVNSTAPPLSHSRRQRPSHHFSE